MSGAPEKRGGQARSPGPAPSKTAWGGSPVDSIPLGAHPERTLVHRL